MVATSQVNHTVTSHFAVYNTLAMTRSKVERESCSTLLRVWHWPETYSA